MYLADLFNENVKLMNSSRKDCSGNRWLSGEFQVFLFILPSIFSKSLLSLSKISRCVTTVDVQDYHFC